MTGRRFGTDGIRAPFGEPPLDRPTVTALARALAATLREGAGGQPAVVLGGDTRESTPALCRWLAAGLAAGGVETLYAGVVPTPGIAYLTRRRGAAAGVVVSASHNPYPDNGIKLIDGEGFKWSEEAEAALEGRLEDWLGKEDGAAESPLAEDPSLREEYLAHLTETVPGAEPFAGLRVVLDAGHGATSFFALAVFERLGARVTLLHAAPDGRNVNAGCGSTEPGEMAARVAAEGADVGAAFDGDGDRCILSDERGEVRDGDAVLYLWGTALAARGDLLPPSVVATSMSNLGLERAFAREGIALVRCGVGDRLVVEKMRETGIRLGGEQSGHVVEMSLATTGDGLLTALQMARLVREAGGNGGRPLSQLLAGFRRYPQVLLNVPVARKPDLATLPRVAAAARAVEERLGADGRLVLRYSGTEPLARIMIEGPDQATVEALAGEIAGAIRDELGA
ncbi:MAG TPA: phosphoglucosamine mutase [Solirubrobacteraceae bacterium]|nr:phosphoglucosamine mutase [Solirubrobacteraceae bacterium]